MRVILKIITLILFLTLGAYAKDVKFIHITDINLNTNNAYKLKRTIDEINSFKDIDFVVFGGNNIEKANFENLETFLYLLKKVNKKCYVLLGSNDCQSTSGINKDYYFKRVRRALLYRHNKKQNYVFKKRGQIFIVMDGSKQYFYSSNGYYSTKELDFLEKQLQKYKNKKVVILQHFPLLPSNSSWLQTAKPEDYIKLLMKYQNVSAIISGHYGSNYETKIGGIYNIITESYDKAGAYKIIEIDLDDDFIGTYLVK